MPSFKRPGVYVEESLSPDNTASSSASVSAGAIAGPANRGPEEVATVASFNEFKTVYGGFETGDLAYAAHQFFQNGGSKLHVRRVAGSGATLSTRTLNDRATTPLATLKVDALNKGAWGNSIYIDITDGDTGRFNINVYHGSANSSDLVEQWTDLSMVDSDDRYVETVINHTVSGSNYIKVTDLDSATAGNDANPALQAGTSLTGGADGTTAVAADVAAILSDFDDVTDPFTLNLPNQTTNSLLASAITYAEGRGDVFVVVDSVAGDDPATAVTFANGLSGSSYAAVYYPRVHFSDPGSSQSNALKLLPVGAAVMGLFARTDGDRGVFKAPAGLAAQLNGAISLERKLTNGDLDTLNASHVNAVRQIPGAGVVVMGARTLKKRQADKYVPVRRTLTHLKAVLSDITTFAVFEPNDSVLWDRLETVVGTALREFWLDGGLRGSSADQAFYVKCDAELNTQTVIDQGKVLVEVGVALQQPAEFVVIRIGQWQGGSSAADVVNA